MKKYLSLLALCLLTGITSVYAQDNLIDNSAIKTLDLKEFSIRFVINLVSIFFLVRVIYFIRHKNKDFLFTYILFNSINFLICFLLSGANLGVGFAFGLFAIFSIMRYRTVTLPVKEMGYLFLCVALALLNALAPLEGNFIVLIGANIFILLVALFLDRTTSVTYSHDDSKQIEKNTKKIEKIMEQLKNGFAPVSPIVALDNHNASIPEIKENTVSSNIQDITYERIDLIKPELRDEMIADLRERTGLPVYWVEILKIDLMRDVAEIRVHYRENEVLGNHTPKTAYSLF